MSGPFPNPSTPWGTAKYVCAGMWVLLVVAISVSVSKPLNDLWGWFAVLGTWLAVARVALGDLLVLHNFVRASRHDEVEAARMRFKLGRDMGVLAAQGAMLVAVASVVSEPSFGRWYLGFLLLNVGWLGLQQHEIAVQVAAIRGDTKSEAELLDSLLDTAAAMRFWILNNLVSAIALVVLGGLGTVMSDAQFYQASVFVCIANSLIDFAGTGKFYTSPLLTAQTLRRERSSAAGSGVRFGARGVVRVSAGGVDLGFRLAAVIRRKPTGGSA